MTQTHKPNTALPPDVYRELFSSFFESDEFQAWRKAESRWQLRLIGGPGTGKTTLARLALDELERQSGPTPVAAIFIRYGCSLPATELIAEVLDNISQQLLPQWPNGQSRRSEEIPQDEETLERNRQSLKTVLSLVGHAFLVIDGLDHCRYEAWFRLEEELSKLKNDGLSILVTSRVPFQRDTTIYACEHCSDGYVPVKIYWQCHSCCNEDSLVCVKCKIDGDVCPRHGSVLSEPYERIYVDIDIEITTHAAIEGYIRWDLEREHGDLGLGSSNEVKPPASSLCKSLARHKDSNAAQELVSYITEKADEDITQARLRLDLVREAETVNSTQHTIFGLPGSVIAVFESGIKCIQEQEEPARTLGLNSICLVTTGHAYEGIEAGYFMEKLQALCNMDPEETAKSCFLDEIIHASRGFLSVYWHVSEDKEKVRSYHHDFFYYVLEDYNESLSAVRRNIKIN